MPNEQPPANQETATALVGRMPFNSIIGAPMVAAVEAQAEAAISSVDFIRKVGFDKDGKVVNVTFKYDRPSFSVNDPNQSTVSGSLEVPLLTLVPIPFLRIDTLDIDLKTHIQAENTVEQRDAFGLASDGAVSGKGSWLFASASVSASVSTKKDSASTRNSKYSVEHTIDIKVHAVQDDMPAGMAKVLGILTDCILRTEKAASA